jgi:hypothetical protein
MYIIMKYSLLGSHIEIPMPYSNHFVRPSVCPLSILVNRKLISPWTFIMKFDMYLGYDMQITGADPGFVVRGGVSRRGVWGPLRVPSGSIAELW